MTVVNSFEFPDIPTELSDILLRDDKTMIIVGVIGKSSHPDCNKMAGLNMLRTNPALAASKHQEGGIKFYFEKDSKMLFIHFETSYDTYVMLRMLEEWHKTANGGHSIDFHRHIRIRFARILLFAIQVCHIIVMVETASSFDSSYLLLFKSLKIIREKYVLKFLPKFLKNSNVGSFMGKEGRLCSPRFIFFFEKCPYNIGSESNSTTDHINKLEFEVEDDIYKMLRNEFIITNNSSMSLFSIPRNKRFVYFTTDTKFRCDPIKDSILILHTCMEKSSGRKNHEDEEDDLDEYRPFKGFAKPWNSDKKVDTRFDKVNERSVLNLIKEHVNEALQFGFDDSMSKYRGKSHFVTPTVKTWFDAFKILHKLFLENPDLPNFEANDVDYKAFLENFPKMIDLDERFFTECCEHGLECGISNYNELLPHHYNRTFHEQKLHQAIQAFLKYARGPETEKYEKCLRETCENTWISGKQQCEYPSLRGNPCIMVKHSVTDLTEHSSGVVFVSTCNCGRTQGHREDPYTTRQANYEFYQIIGKSCSACLKLEHVIFPIFQPSTNDYKAAPGPSDISDSYDTSLSGGTSNWAVSDFASQPSTSSSNASMSYPYLDCLENMMKVKRSNTNNNEEEEELREKLNSDDDEICDDDDENSFNEIVIKVGGENVEYELTKFMLRQPSTTEYLPGMVTTTSPVGLLPMFPSWSLLCIGPSSIYSHNTGLPEHIQSGFLTGANYLLPWDVQVRLEHAAEWAASYEAKSRNRKKSSKSGAPLVPTPSASNPDSVFSLKIFVGNEYECPRGHRFIMCTPDKILRGGAGIVRDSGSKVVFNDMPLYFPCPCRTATPLVAQLMRIHIVTPKAPVNVIADPKIKIGGKNSAIFVSGLSEPAKLSQSTYWILRLPYVYQGDDGPIHPPLDISTLSSSHHGYLMAGMFGIAETTDNNALS